MAATISLRLTARSYEAIRPSDALSARVNQILERYLLMTAATRDKMRAEFTAAHWHEMQRTLQACSIRGQSAQDQTRTFLSGIGDSPLRAHVGAFDSAHLFALFDALESDA